MSKFQIPTPFKVFVGAVLVGWFIYSRRKQNSRLSIQLAHYYRTGTGGRIQNHEEAFRIYQQLVVQEQNNEAEQWIAYYHLTYFPDRKKAFEISQLGVNKKFPAAYNNLGICYQLGIGVEKNLEESVQIFRKGMELDDLASITSLAECYKKGTLGIAQDEKEAFRLYQLAAKKGDADAQYHLAFYYYNGNQVEQDIKETIRLFELAVEQGQADAQYQLGLCYMNGIGGIPINLSRGTQLFALATIQGIIPACYNMGVALERGIGVEKDLNKAFESFHAAAQLGFSLAQNQVAYYFMKGMGTLKDEQKAIQYYLLAAAQGQEDAQNSLGILYEEGVPGQIEKNEKKAIEYYRLAAEQGHANAQFHLGKCYELGKGGLAIDLKEAVRYYKQAIVQEDIEAYDSLGRCYENGIGVKINKKKAEEYYDLAAEKGSKESETPFYY